ncbi:MAG: NUDIX domain-containing protein [Clostridia bacterium]|nr:NUDIX domain-containing protein [Clostridia bacterium]
MIKYEERYMCPAAVIVALITFDEEKDGSEKVLLQKRRGTGFADGLWDLSSSGHVEEGESVTAAAARETKEETGYEIPPEDFHFMAYVHKKDRASDGSFIAYHNIYFWALVEDGEGRECAGEPDKTEKLAWFFADELPDSLIPDRRLVFENCLGGSPQCFELGWDT